MLRTETRRKTTILRGSLGALVALALLACSATAVAKPVQQFSVQLKDFRSGGRFSVVYASNAFDTTGQPPPALTSAYMRMPKGMVVKPEFLRPSRFCEIAKFVGFVYQNLPKGVSYAQFVDQLPRGLTSIEKRVPKEARSIVANCRNAFLGLGKTVVDARPLYDNLIPARFAIFLTKPAAKGAIFGIGVLSHYDRRSPIATTVPREVVLQPTFRLNVFNAPTKDGLYGYRVKLLAENSTGLRFSIAELRVESKGIVGVTAKRTCTKRRGGRCVSYRTRRVSTFWAKPPVCPKSGKVQFKADYSYKDGSHVTSVIKVPCPRYKV